MAKFELKFICNDDDKVFIKTYSDQNQVVIVIENHNEKIYSKIYLDKSTAIKFAKTIRTEINKITDNEIKYYPKF